MFPLQIVDKQTQLKSCQTSKMQNFRKFSITEFDRVLDTLLQCVKSVQIRSYFWPVFGLNTEIYAVNLRIWTPFTQWRFYRKSHLHKTLKKSPLLLAESLLVHKIEGSSWKSSLSNWERGFCSSCGSFQILEMRENYIH